ncbi:caspase family protein [Rhizobium ruizarguesonis]|uniref:caspase family protein n=1 Tax=Rhizobium ruizarguesonis TaxID=2081791 RepID=UPI0013B8819D|nr:caspase family protein [Rhizobium ruizarguesonis]NEH61730.1 caspase family protein [Rhizobium ruizarguesonis]
MADRQLKILGVHGLGDQRASGWAQTWTNALGTAFPKVPGLAIKPEFMTYDDIFEKTEISFAESVSAVWKLAKSGATETFRRERGIVSDISDRIKWTAGYVVAWVEDENFKRRTRKRVYDAILEHQPDVILAHSLGSLITYNAFAHNDAKSQELAEILGRAHYVTFGSQIGNPFVIRNLTNGRIHPLDVDFWYHLYNVHDDVFTAPIRLPDARNFSQTDTPFDDEGVADHSAVGYLTNPATISNVWRSIAAETTNARVFAPSVVAQTRSVEGKDRKRQKALLIGINDYPDPANRLEGCINDVFTMSSVLQDCGVPPEAIRTCLDKRATAEGIKSRLQWLLDDPKPGDELVFYYSGHGARVPEYGNNFEPDHYVETLVPWDFNWSPETYLADDQIYELYSQLPYDTRLIMIFDCCHSGGIHRDGGARPRGITPPDDIRHRELKWDSKTQMWVSRDFQRIVDEFSPKKDVEVRYFGNSGASERIGRASMLRGISSREYNRLKKQDPALAAGPYLPLIIEACGEDQLSYEYRHGATSYGAFTYSLASILRSAGKVTFEDLVDKTRVRLEDLQYNQKPQILGPTAVLQSEVPWRAA